MRSRPEGARPVVGDRGTDRRHAPRRPRRAGHQDRAARRRPVPLSTGARVWHPREAQRGARPSRRTDATFLALVADADVLHRELRARAPRTARDRLRTSLRAPNPRLSTARSPDTATASTRIAPAVLRRARRGPHRHAVGAAWRGRRRRSRARSRGGANLPDWTRPTGVVDGTDRPGPLFPASTWPSLAAFIASRDQCRAATRARSRVAGSTSTTSLLQGALDRRRGAAGSAPSTPIAAAIDTWIFDSRATRGILQVRRRPMGAPLGANPAFVLGASEGDELRHRPTRARRTDDDPTRISPSPEEIVVCTTTTRYGDDVPEVPGRRLGAPRRQVGSPMQPVRSPRSGARATPTSRMTGCVTEVDDPELGPHQSGRDHLPARRHADGVRGPAPRSASTREVRAEAAAGRVPRSRPRRALARRAARRHRRARPRSGGRRAVRHPAAGRPRRDVIKVNSALRRVSGSSTHIAMACNRGKRSLAVNLKHAGRAWACCTSLVARRRRACSTTCATTRRAPRRRLRVAQQINPALIYCHTRGFEHGPRDAAARQRPDRRRARRTSWEDGGVDDGRQPIWAAPRSATPATASCPRSASSRPSTTATAPARGSSSTRRSRTRGC